MFGWVVKTAMAIMCVFFKWSAVTVAAPIDSSSVHLKAGAIELGLAGSFTAVEGLSRATISVQAGTFLRASSGLAGVEFEVAYSHVNDLNLIDFQSNLSYQRQVRESPVYLFFALGGGLRQEWLGSFQQIRYPIGFNLGLRTLISQSAGVRLQYSFRRILHDPVSNFNEHQIVLGVSIFLKNSR